MKIAGIVGKQAGEQRFVIGVERGDRTGHRSLDWFDQRGFVSAAGEQQRDCDESASLRTNRHDPRSITHFAILLEKRGSGLHFAPQPLRGSDDPQDGFLTTLAASFFLDAHPTKREARPVMHRFASVLTPALLVLAFACAEDPEEPNAFNTQGNTTNAATDDSGSDTGVPQDLPSTGDGDGDPTTGDGDGDGDPTTTGDGDGDGDAICGNGLVDDGEQCDGGNLNGFSCTDLGYSGGTLGCDAITCTYDASGCITGGTNGGGTTG